MARMTMVAVVAILACAAAYGARNLMFPAGTSWIYHVGPLLVAFVLVLPLVVYYALRVTNRLIAPVIRLWHLTRLMVEDRQQVRPIEFREDDPWNELAHDFNHLLAYVQEQLDARRTDHVDQVTTAAAEANVEEAVL